MVWKGIHFVSAPFAHGLAVEQDLPFARLRLRVGAVEANGGDGQRSQNERENQFGMSAHDSTCCESCIGCDAGRSSVRTSGQNIDLTASPRAKAFCPQAERIARWLQSAFPRRHCSIPPAGFSPPCRSKPAFWSRDRCATDCAPSGGNTTSAHAHRCKRN